MFDRLQWSKDCPRDQCTRLNTVQLFVVDYRRTVSDRQEGRISVTSSQHAVVKLFTRRRCWHGWKRWVEGVGVREGVLRGRLLDGRRGRYIAPISIGFI